MRNVGRAFGALLFSLLSGSTLASEEAVRALASAYNDFGQEIFASLEKKKGNIVYSPYSAGVAFSMAMSGASGATRAEFLKAMGFSQSVAEIESANGELALLLASYAGERLDPATVAASARIACLQKPNAKASDCEAEAQAAAKAGEPLTELNVANLLAIAKGPVSQGYKTVIAAKYGGEVFEDATPQRINAWAAEKTKGHVTHVVDWRPDEAPAFILADAVYFHGRWDEAFHAASTKPRPFTTASGAKADVATMQKVESLPYLDDEAFEIAWLPYRTEALGMMLVLPKEGLLTGGCAGPTRPGGVWPDSRPPDEERADAPRFAAAAVLDRGRGASRRAGEGAGLEAAFRSPSRRVQECFTAGGERCAFH